MQDRDLSWYWLIISVFHVFLLYQVFEAASPVFLEIILLGSVFMYTSVSESKFLFSYSASLMIQVSGSHG